MPPAALEAAPPACEASAPAALLGAAVAAASDEGEAVAEAVASEVAAALVASVGEAESVALDISVGDDEAEGGDEEGEAVEVWVRLEGPADEVCAVEDDDSRVAEEEAVVVAASEVNVEDGVSDEAVLTNDEVVAPELASVDEGELDVDVEDEALECDVVVALLVGAAGAVLV